MEKFGNNKIKVNFSDYEFDLMLDNGNNLYQNFVRSFKKNNKDLIREIPNITNYFINEPLAYER